MILSRPDILRYIDGGKLTINPMVNRDVDIAQVSVDLRLGRRFTKLKSLPPYIPAICVDKSLFSSLDLWEELTQDEFDLEPGEFVLAQTMETIGIPNDLVGLVEGRSSWARVGITIHVTAPKIDPGFKAPITLEMANFGKATVRLRAGIDKPAQLMLLRISTELDAAQLYGNREGDIFQGQSDPIARKKASGRGQRRSAIRPSPEIPKDPKRRSK